jgi:AhpD family alkylhydroperoxidase
MANSPQVIRAYSEMGKLFGQTSFNQVEKNIIWLVISRTNGCHYCTAIHSMVAKMSHVPEDIIEAVRSYKPIHDRKLQALRLFTVIMVEKRGWASEQEVQDFLSAGYTQAQILELIVGIAQKTISNYVNHIAGTPLDEPVKPFAWQKESYSV